MDIITVVHGAEIVLFIMEHVTLPWVGVVAL